MNLAEQLQEQIAYTFDLNERSRLRCRLAKELEEGGDYEEACAVLSELWERVGERPKLEGLTELTQAEVLMRVGALSGWIGSSKQMPDAQERAKDLITESITIFEALHDTDKVYEAQVELAYCYWRQGRFDEARDILREVLDHLADAENELKMVAIIRSAVVERTSKKYYDALSIHTKYAALFEQSTNLALKGKFHNGLAIVLEILGKMENRGDYIDSALIEYTAASVYFEQVGQTRHHALVENNLAMLYQTVGRFAEAHEHLDRARPILAGLKDNLHVAQVDETRAKVLLGERRYVEAERIVGRAVQVLERGDEQCLLAEALTTHGIALARTGHHARARLTLQRAIAVAEQAGDNPAAGRAALVVIEELSENIAEGELCTLFEQAADRLTKSQHPNLTARLIAAARLVLNRLKPQTLTTEDAPANWQGFSFRKAIHRYERNLIERALKDARGVVTRAAELLGFPHHQSLISLLNNRHKDLLAARSPVVPRKRSIIREEHGGAEKQTQHITILYAEDNRLVADTVRDTLELKGWEVDTCFNGAIALKRIESNSAYDLFLFDSDLPRINGLELVRRARRIPHRRRTPIIMLSASDCEREAWQAGVTAFLRKPDDVPKLAENIIRVLTIGSKF